jgi:chromosome partitioning protein
MEMENESKEARATGKATTSRSGASSSFVDYQFNIKQIADLLKISRTAIYQLEKLNAIKGQPVSPGTSTKRMFSWDDHAAIAERYRGKLKSSADKVKVFYNMKGGVGKSSLSSQIAMRSSSCGVKTLLIDLDPQGHTSLALGFDIASESYHTIFNCMVGKGEERLPIDAVIQKWTPFLDIIPAHLSLSSLEFKLFPEHRRTEKLRELIDPLRNKYDLIVIDTNPAPSLLNINALLACDELCVVCATDFLSVSSLKQLFDMLHDLQEDFKDFGPAVRIIPNLFDVREAIAQESLGVLRQNYGKRLTNTVVRKNVDLKEAQKNAQAVWLYNRKSPAAEDIISLTEELLSEAP